MLLVRTTRLLLKPYTYSFISRTRLYNTNSFKVSAGHRLRTVTISGGILLTLGFGLSQCDFTVHGDAPNAEFPSSPRAGARELSLSDLIRAYVVYMMCSIPPLVDYSPKILDTLSAIPGIKQITEAIVRVTFFNQFVGGDTAHETLPLLARLRSSNKGALFAYSVEVDESEASGSGAQKPKIIAHKEIVDEMVNCIDVAADFEAGQPKGRGRSGRTWVAVKITALLPDAHALINLSSHITSRRPAVSHPVAFPGSPHPSDLDVLHNRGAQSSLSQEDILALRDLQADLIRICTRAQQRGVRIIIDAEYSWYQPAIDALTLSLSRQFNQLPRASLWSYSTQADNVQPLIYGTYQAYLRRAPEHLQQALADAKAANYALGVKLVRGAYHPHETAAHNARATGTSLSISSESLPPVWTTKEDTDVCYNKCAKLLVAAVKDDIVHARPAAPPRVGVLFGTHNWASCNLILNDLVTSGLGTLRKDSGADVVELGDNVTERITFGQLYGMGDKLTNYIVDKTRSSTPFVIKYVPYGALSDVMPYLARRAIENKSVLGDGGASDERKRAGAEIRMRLFG